MGREAKLNRMRREQRRARQRLNWWRLFGLAACIASACVVFGAIRYLLS